MATRAKKDLKEEGSTYYFSPTGSFKAPKIDAAGIGQILDNKAIDEGLTHQQLAIFENPVELSVMNLDEGEIDQDMTNRLMRMAKQDDVAIDFFIQRAWRDMAEWGITLTNPVWDYVGSEFRLLKLKRLKPYSFQNMGRTVSYVYNPILPGILLNDETQQIEYWQTNEKSSIPKQVKNVEVLTDSSKDGFGGTPAIIPIFPYVKMLTYSWMRQMQKVNQYGSGGIWFLKVTDPTGDDKKFAQNVVNNISSTNRYQLRPNMTIENLGISESGSALETITQLGMEIKTFFSPAGLIQKEGSGTIGGSSSSELDLYNSFIKAKRGILQDYIRRLFNPWLEYNNYDLDVYEILAIIPAKKVESSELYLKIHDSGSKEGSLLPNEKRALLRAALPQQAGVDIADLNPAELIELDAYAAKAKPTPNAQFQKLDSLSKVMAATPDNPLVNRSKAKKIVQAVLGIEENPDEDDDTPLQSDAIGAINRLSKAASELSKANKE